MVLRRQVEFPMRRRCLVKRKESVAKKNTIGIDHKGEEAVSFHKTQRALIVFPC